MIDAIVVVDGTILSAETQRALTDVTVAAVGTSGAIFARIEFFGAELNFLFAKVS